MASGGHHLQQQKGGLETKIRTLVNDDLKALCRAYGYQVSGAKNTLVTRCLESKAPLTLESGVDDFTSLISQPSSIY